MTALGFEDLVCRALDGDPTLTLAPRAVAVRAGTVLLAGPPELLVRGSCDGSWMLLEGSAVLDLPPSHALARIGTLRGAAKLAMTAAGTIQTRAELPLADVSTLAVRLDSTLVGMMQAVDTPVAAPSAIPRAAAAGSPASPTPDLAELCAAAGWEGRGRDACAVRVALDVRDGTCAEVAYLAAGGAVRVAAAVDSPGPELDAACEEGLALLLLRAAAAVRFVRPAVWSGGGRRVVGFEAVFAAPVVASEIGHALAALEVAVAMTSGEATVLARDAALARAYLALDGSPPSVGPAGPTPTAGLAPAEGATR